MQRAAVEHEPAQRIRQHDEVRANIASVERRRPAQYLESCRCGRIRDEERPGGHEHPANGQGLVAEGEVRRNQGRATRQRQCSHGSVRRNHGHIQTPGRDQSIGNDQMPRALATHPHCAVAHDQLAPGHKHDAGPAAESTDGKIVIAQNQPA